MAPSDDPGTYLPLTDLSLGILLALGEGPRHGYGVIQDIEAREGRPSGLRSGTLYTALQRLREAGLVEPSAAPKGGDVDPRRKYFALTGLGRAVARAELARLRALVAEGEARRLIDAPRGA